MVGISSSSPSEEDSSVLVYVHVCLEPERVYADLAAELAGYCSAWVHKIAHV